MKAIILLAHGSRRKESNDEVVSLATRLGERASGGTIVRHAFAELTEPTLPDTVADAVESGATEILVIPYFLAKGRHVVEDVPNLIEESKTIAKGVPITTTRHIGDDDYMLDLLQKIASQDEDR